MSFRIYDTPEETLTSWSKQLTNYTQKRFREYDDAEETLVEWQKILNKTPSIQTNQVFILSDTPEETITRWQQQLNSIFLN